MQAGQQRMQSPSRSRWRWGGALTLILGGGGLALGLAASGLGWWVAPEVVDTVPPEALSAALAPQPSLPLSATATDVVLVALCTLRRDRLEPYGHTQPSSPFLRQLADTGVRMQKHIAQAPWTRPSMAALVTGLWPRALRIDNLDSGASFRRAIGASHTLLSEHLQAAGYATVGVATNPNLNAMFGFAQGFDVYDEPRGRYRDEPYRKNAAEAVDTALALAAAVPPGQRLYLQINLTDTHKPRRVLRRYLRLMDSERRGLREYDAAVRYVDAHLARLLVGLKQTRPNLLFVVAADHGEGLMLPRHHGPEHGNFVYQTTVQTPLLWHHPALSHPGRAVGALSMNIDVLPTILDLLGLPRPTAVDGRSQAAAVQGQTDQTPWAQVFAETFFRSTHRSTVLDGEFQLIRTHPGPVDALYAADDWKAERDLHASLPAVAAALGSSLTAWEAAQDAREAAAPPVDGVPLDDNTTQMLQELGYLE